MVTRGLARPNAARSFGCSSTTLWTSAVARFEAAPVASVWSAGTAIGAVRRHALSTLRRVVVSPLLAAIWISSIFAASSLSNTLPRGAVRRVGRRRVAVPLDEEEVGAERRRQHGEDGGVAPAVHPRRLHQV